MGYKDAENNTKYNEFLKETTALAQGEKSYEDLEKKRKGVKFSPKEVAQGNAAYEDTIRRLAATKSQINPAQVPLEPTAKAPAQAGMSDLASAFGRLQANEPAPQEDVELSAEEVNAPRSMDESSDGYQKRLKLQALMRLRGQ